MKTLLEYINKTRKTVYHHINHRMKYDDMVGELEKSKLINVSSSRYISKDDLIKEFISIGKPLFYTYIGTNTSLPDIIVVTKEKDNIVVYVIEESAMNGYMEFVYIYIYNKYGRRLGSGLYDGEYSEKYFDKINDLAV